MRILVTENYRFVRKVLVTILLNSGRKIFGFNRVSISSPSYELVELI